MKGKQIVNKNTYNVTNEIDYDKLAEAIVKSLNQSGDDKGEESSIASTFSGLCSSVFVILSVFMGVLALAFISIPWSAYFGLVSGYFDSLPLSMATVFCLFAIFLFFCVILGKAAKEISVEKDKSFIISLFSSIVSVAAMIISAATLFYTINPK